MGIQRVALATAYFMKPKESHGDLERNQAIKSSLFRITGAYLRILWASSAMGSNILIVFMLLSMICVKSFGHIC